MQRPQELSRPRRTAGGGGRQGRTHSTSNGGPVAPKLSLAAGSPGPTSLRGDPGTTSLQPGFRLAERVSAHTVMSHQAWVRGPSSEWPRAQERSRRDGRSSEQGERWDRQGCKKIQGVMLVRQKTMGRQRREDGGGGAEDLNLPAARSQDGPPLALGVDTMRSLCVSLPRPLPRLVFSLRLEAWRFLSP